jgi:hypothetical protein
MGERGAVTQAVSQLLATGIAAVAGSSDGKNDPFEFAKRATCVERPEGSAWVLTHDARRARRIDFDVKQAPGVSFDDEA